jgi:SAM-dependent methyltransferase
VSDATYFAAAVESGLEVERLTLRESLFDSGTVAMLNRIGVPHGWRCLVAGAGHGSIARWLADRVAPTGSVVATDIDTQFLTWCTGPNLEVRRHDVLNEPLEPDSYDLVHSRGLLLHLVDRQRQAIDRLVGAARVGGWLVIDESDAATFGPADPSHPAFQTVTEIIAAALDASKQRVDRHGGRHTAATLIRHPQLRVISTDITATLERGGSPWGQYMAQTAGIVVSALRDAGEISTTAAETFDHALADTSFLFLTEMRYQIIAQKVGDSP